MRSMFGGLRRGGLLALLGVSTGCIPVVTRKAYIVEDAKNGTLHVTLKRTTTAYGLSVEGFNWMIPDDRAYTLTEAMRDSRCPEGVVYRVDTTSPAQQQLNVCMITIDEHRRFVYFSLYHLRPPLGLEKEPGSGVYPVGSGDGGGLNSTPR